MKTQITEIQDSGTYEIYRLIKSALDYLDEYYEEDDSDAIDRVYSELNLAIELLQKSMWMFIPLSLSGGIMFKRRPTLAQFVIVSSLILLLAVKVTQCLMKCENNENHICDDYHKHDTLDSRDFWFPEIEDPVWKK